jgi:hypothetical protein
MAHEHVALIPREDMNRIAEVFEETRKVFPIRRLAEIDDRSLRTAVERANVKDVETDRHVPA